MYSKNNLRYTTIFPECEPVHLKKDVGMLPYSLGKYKNYDYKIVCFQNKKFTNKEIKKFHIDFIKHKKGVQGFVKYLLLHGRKIDILNLYHISSVQNIFMIIAYKCVNPNGKIHLKLDADYRMINLVDMDPNNFLGKIRVDIFKKKVDLYTIESKKIKSILEKKWKIKMKLIPNGIFREEHINPVLFEEKKKVFLTVGRLGTEQKATEDLVDAFKLISQKTNWDLWLVGSIEPSFKIYLKNMLENHPYLKKRIKIWGYIRDAEKLTELYRQASVFVLPSKYEGFAIALIEALECGEYLIVSDMVPSVDDIGKNGIYASVTPVHQVNKLADKMLESTFKEISNDILKERNTWIMENFTWKVIVDSLDNELQKLFNNKKSS